MIGRNFVRIAFALLAAGSTPAAAENLQGYGKGMVTRQIDLSHGGTPLLQSFYVRFTGTDHHFSALEVMPNQPSVARASILYRDQNFSFFGSEIVPEYFYNITFAPYYSSFNATRVDFCGGGNGTCSYPIDGPPDRQNYVFVLRGFFISYRANDHHLEEMRIQEQNGRIIIALNDKNDDDTFRVDLSYAYIPRSQFAVVSSRTGTTRGGARAAIENGLAVIRGFHFDFELGHPDHHIQDIGVVMNGSGQLDVYYGDKNKDDLFAWTVDYAVFGRVRPFPPIPPLSPVTERH